jgi:hypothetical protein
MALNKTQLRILSELEVGSEPEVVTNPYSQVSVLLPPKAVALYDFIKGCEMLRTSQKDFDQARYAFAELWPDAYIKLLD